MQKLRLYCLLLTVCCLLPTAVAAQENDVALKTTISRDSILIGDPVHWTLQATVNPATRIAFPRIDSTFFPGLALLQPQQYDTLKDKSGKEIYQTSFVFTSYDAGVYTLPAMPMLIDRGGYVDTLFFQPVQLQVKSFDIDTATFKPFDIKPPIKYPVTFGEIVPFILLGLFLVAIALLLIYFIRRWRSNQPIFGKIKPVEPPEVIAMRELQKIKEEKLWQDTGKVKLYYTRITDVLRNYIEARYQVPAMEQTSDEILHSLHELKLPEELLRKVQEMLSVSDLVKFAKYTPTIDDNEHNLNTTRQFVEITTPAVEVKTASATLENEEKIKDTKEDSEHHE